MCQEKRKTIPIIDERPHSFLLSLGAHLSSSIIPCAHRMCQHSIYTQQMEQSISGFATGARAQRACPTLGIFGRILRNGVRCAGSIGGPQTKGATEYGS